MPLKTDAPVRAFASPGEWRRWLARHHARPQGVWLRFFTKASGTRSIAHAQALEEALCYGWIDGQLRKGDEHSWLQKFTPRRRGSLWSKKNTLHAARLIRARRMTPRGLAEIRAAKADGRWERAYESSRGMRVPEDFLKELSKNARAKAFFETLNKTNLYAIAWRLQTAKTAPTRTRRMRAILEKLAAGEKFH